jgi:uncharacterized membrane-anchored protein
LFLVEKQAQQLLRKMGNPNVKDVKGVITGPRKDWMVVVRYEKTGYIKDGDAKNWNPDELLESIKEGTEQTNQLRGKQKAVAVEILGWLEKPAYDAKLHRLTWAIAVRDKNAADLDSQGVNYNTYALGKEGYFSLNLVTGLQHIAGNKPHLVKLLSGLEFRDGKKYSDFKAGTDKVTRYGLNTLVAGSIPTRKPGWKGAVGEFFSDYGAWLLGIVVAILLAAIGYAVWFFLRKRRKMAGDTAELSEAIEPTMDEVAAPAPKKA